MNYNPELHLRGRCVDEGALGMILFKISWLCSNCFFSSRWNCETRCANYAQNFGGTCHSNILEHTLLQLLGNVISAREWCNKNANTVLYVFYESKRTLTPPLNPPKARHSSGRPWESLWEVLELWGSLGGSGAPLGGSGGAPGGPGKALGGLYPTALRASPATVPAMVTLNRKKGILPVSCTLPTAFFFCTLCLRGN